MSISPEANDGETVTESIVGSSRAFSDNGKDAGTASGRNGTRLGLEAIKRELLLKRSEILRQQDTQLSELFSPEKLHLADLEEMSDTTDTDSLCALVDLGSSTVEQIDAALEKIEQGNYGVCELCDRPISEERLEVLPFAALCVDCQRKKELED
jgi:RNA polymerase-binding protein DksA